MEVTVPFRRILEIFCILHTQKKSFFLLRNIININLAKFQYQPLQLLR